MPEQESLSDVANILGLVKTLVADLQGANVVTLESDLEAIGADLQKLAADGNVAAVAVAKLLTDLKSAFPSA